MPKPRGVLIAGNWKMNHGLAETEEFLTTFSGQMADGAKFGELRQALQSNRLKTCLFPPYLCLDRARSWTSRFPFSVHIGAQNAHWEKKGAFTGEVSGPMLNELGIHWILVGHSERRQYFGETDQTVRKKVESLLEQGFHVILCIGETRAERESGKTKDVLTRQIEQGLPNLGSQNENRLTLAYEPVWAIGKGLTASPEQAEEAHLQIRTLLTDRLGNIAATKISLLYGGSVTPENIHALLACPNVDGALVGGACLKVDNYISLLQAGAKAILR
jgi:triosephosphate isomerase